MWVVVLSFDPTTADIIYARGLILNYRLYVLIIYSQTLSTLVTRSFFQLYKILLSEGLIISGSLEKIRKIMKKHDEKHKLTKSLLRLVNLMKVEMII